MAVEADGMPYKQIYTQWISGGYHWWGPQWILMLIKKSTYG